MPERDSTHITGDKRSGWTVEDWDGAGREGMKKRKGRDCDLY